MRRETDYETEPSFHDSFIHSFIHSIQSIIDRAQNAATKKLRDGTKAICRRFKGLEKFIVRARECPLLMLVLSHAPALRSTDEALEVVIAKARLVVRVHAEEVDGRRLQRAVACGALGQLEDLRAVVDLANL